MFLKETTQKTSHERKSKLGKVVKYTREKVFYHFKCDHCGKEFSSAKNGKLVLRNNIHFCSDCPQKSLMAKESAKAKLKKTEIRGKKYDRGYPEIYAGPNYPYRKVSWIREHIAVMENHIQKKIPDGMVVHHIDGTKDNNCIENLLLCSVAEHNKCHAKIERLVFELYQLGIVGFDKSKMEYYYKKGNDWFSPYW